ncbi:hypothetical protein CLRAG_13390 [Clostridium ragsdalei P11]|uniref:Uncharacterized protein n=1 Tax=Clostridium ragsdalei P11 TaxID=1353534 RepID=A0A1A6AY43_9CLOT|nr:hypothetical protein CLRAG_13390 [Clostridium ragsdalei P11]
MKRLVERVKKVYINEFNDLEKLLKSNPGV